MTLPKSDAQSSRLLPRRPQMTPPTHSMPIKPSVGQPTLIPFHTSPVDTPKKDAQDEKTHEHPLDFATNSWDLATGSLKSLTGLKTLTAKRELPMRQDRRAAETVPPEAMMMPRSYTLALVVLACLVLILIGGGVVLYVMLQL